MEDLMDAQQARKFRARWQAVAAAEAKEQATASITLHWQQLNAIFQLAMGLGLLPLEESENESAYHHWALLKGNVT